MQEDAVRCALLVTYTALCEAMAVATNKPVGELANHLIDGMMQVDGVPPEARDVLREMIQNS